MRKHLTALAVAAALLAGAAPARAHGPESKVSLVYDQPLPNVPGKSMRAVLVDYPAGGASPAHRHPSTAFIYATVLEGAVVSQINDGPETTYAAGQSFTEHPGDRHGVSRNASATAPAKLLAVFVVDTDERELVLPY